MEAIETVRERARLLRESIQKSQTTTDSMVTILGSFDHRLSALEAAMRPIQVQTHAIRSAHENIDKTLKGAELMLNQFDLTRQAEAKILKGPHEDLESYLVAVDQLRANIKFFSSNKSFKSCDTVLTHANGLLAKALMKLEEEFKQLLANYSKPMEPDRLIECLPNSLRPPAEGEGGKNSAPHEHHNNKSLETAIYKPPTLIPPRILPLLHDLAQQMVKAGNQQPCLIFFPIEEMSYKALAHASSSLLTSFSPPNPNPNHSSLHCCSPSRSLKIARCSSSPSSSLRESSSSLDLPLLPFQSDEVLIPSESKTLHLYEARFLALLEESMLTKEKLFVHFVLDPVVTSRSASGVSFAARYGCLVLIENIERLDIGALVSIRGIGRVNIVDLVQMEPYLRGVVVPLQDEYSDYESEMNTILKELRESLQSLQTLQIKLKASRDELLQTRLKNSLSWADRKTHKDCDQSFIPKLAERLSFAALQPVSGFSQSELQTLQSEKLRAMDMRDTSERLKIGMKFVKDNIAIVAAKLALQSLEM